MVLDPMSKLKQPVKETVTSETTLLLKVEDLIGLTFGGGDTNIINFKILQTILTVLAAKMRLLEQDVELRFAEEDNMLVDLERSYANKLRVMQRLQAEKKDKKRAKKGQEAQTDKPEKGDDRKKKEAKAKKGKEKKPKGVERVAQSESATRMPSIELVTVSQFKLLDAKIHELLKKTGGVPLPTMPSNEVLLEELSKGTASLPETMEAMQVNARVRAVEHALIKMSGLIAQIAFSGDLPKEVAAIIAQMQIDLEQLALTTGIEIEPLKPAKSAVNAVSSTFEDASNASMKRSGKSKSMIKDSIAAMDAAFITPNEMIKGLTEMQDELLKNMNQLVDNAESACDHAGRAVKIIVEKNDAVLKLDERLTHILSITADYAQQLQGFDAGLVLQLQNFKEQMGHLRSELAGGLVQLEAANSNSESAALVDLKSNYDSLLTDLKYTSDNHASLVTLQKELTNDLKNLIENVEILREEKSDRDEVADGLRDKANINRLKGLLRQPLFLDTRKDLDERLDKSYKKFSRQEHVWTVALTELHQVAASKANIKDVLALRDATNKTLEGYNEILLKLEYALGEPRTALLTRKMNREGASPLSKIAEMKESSRIPQPPTKLPPIRKEVTVEEPCIPAPRQGLNPAKKHACHRWVGGSHTMLTEHTTREVATPALANLLPTRQYTGLGSDGRLYLMEEELLPCIECNKMSNEGAPPPSVDGGGDVP